ncbi:putative G protein-coupled glucose receptor regulating Gpa2 [Lyophyllum shimeji]|uniref:G protein-coupled glucose receptor regulating Gpa2 n=1 Tax=Lyophyllum shimeji TaxID=47721 RepID=A0A9P3UNH2_LYOSH|nr:putative G protein-coupled glucose receptor regulating Gpa2 [Lyophyllum shimeji]
MLYDGIGYFVALAAVNVFNLIFFRVRYWLDIQTAGSSLAYTVSWIMSQRLLIHLYDASRERRNESIEEAITVTQQLDSARAVSRAIRSQFEPKSSGDFDLTVPEFELGTDPGQAELPEELEVQVRIEHTVKLDRRISTQGVDNTVSGAFEDISRGYVSISVCISMEQIPGGSGTMPYTGPEVQGVMILVVVSCISLIAVIALLSTIAVSAFNTRASLDNHLFVRTHVAAYFVSLLLCNFIQAIGSIINTAWVHKMGVYFGETCVLQGVLKQTSDIGTAWWTLAIAAHTFFLLFLQLKTRAFVLWVTLMGGWCAIAALVILGPATVNTEKSGPFFGVSGYWCWISPSYPTQRITLDYIFMFLAAFLSFILYTLIFLRLRGNIILGGGRISFRKKPTAPGSGSWQGRQFADDQAMLVAKKMLLYPVAYFVLVFPLAIARFASWAGNSVPFEVTIFTAAIFLLSGLVNVLLFITIRCMLPAESLRIGHWVLSHPRELPNEAGDQGVAENPNQKFTRTGKPRPPSITISRESLESMYSVYDEEEPETDHPNASPGGGVGSSFTMQNRYTLTFLSTT